MNYKKTAVFSIAIIFFLSCSNEDPFVPVFSVDITADSFMAGGGSKTISLASNVSWNTFSNQDWLSVPLLPGIRNWFNTCIGRRY